jgi:hypothetical protein
MPDVEASINALLNLPRDELVERCRISNYNHPQYVRSECVLYFIRQSKADNNDRHFEDLFRILRIRVQRALPAIERPLAESENALVQASAIEIRDAVLFRFQEILCQDRAGYDERLDYFEIRFDGAIANLRRTARRKTWKEDKRSHPLSYNDETSELSGEVEDALARLNPQSPEKIDDPAYRKRFAAAIDLLPEDQRRVIVLLLNDVQIESKDPEAVTMVKVLACSEKTVRNRRDRAFKALRAALDEDLGE